MAKVFQQKARGSACRPQNINILIAAEGKNATETNYFRSFNREHAGFVIHFVRKGSTDPKNMMKDLADAWKSLKLSIEKGDKAFIVLDLDCDIYAEKLKQIIQLSKKNKHVTFIVSNPCFEVWFLMHYLYSTHPFANSGEVIQALDAKNRIPGYGKSMNVYHWIKDNLYTALANSEKLDQFYNSQGLVWPSNQCSPRTDVPKLINLLLDIEKSYMASISSH